MRKFSMLTAFVFLSSFLVFVPSQADARVASNGETCTIIGTNKADILRGTPGRDVICGLGGNDTIYGGGGDDFIDGGPGNDRIFGEEGDDEIFGGSGNDTIFGGDDDDLIDAGLGNDVIWGGPGADDIDDGPGRDTCNLDIEDNAAVTCDTSAPELIHLALFLQDENGVPLAREGSGTLQVDTSGGLETIQISADVRDNLTPLAGPTNFLGVSLSPTEVSHIRFVHRASGQSAIARFDGNGVVDGTFVGTLHLPQHAAQGTWVVDYFSLVDSVGNKRTLRARDLARRGLPTSFIQTGPGDTTPPQLTSLELFVLDENGMPDLTQQQGNLQVDTSTWPPGYPEPFANILLLTFLKDNFGSPYVDNVDFLGRDMAVEDPNYYRIKWVHRESRQTWFSPWLHACNCYGHPLLDPPGNPDLPLNTLQAGYFVAQVFLPQFAAQGLWSIDEFVLIDAVGNKTVLTTRQLNRLGFPAGFTNNGPTIKSKEAIELLVAG